MGSPPVRLLFLILGLLVAVFVSAAPHKDSVVTNNFAKSIEDVRIISRSEWNAQEPTDPPRRLKVQPASHAIISHTATQSCYIKAKCEHNVRGIQTFHIEAKGWVDIGYNFLVGGDGNVYEGRGWDMAGAHTHNYNNRSIGIAFVGDFVYKTPTLEQIDATIKLLELGVRKGKLAKDYKLIGQRQVVHTQSPGDKLYNVMRQWEHWTNSP